MKLKRKKQETPLSPKQKTVAGLFYVVLIGVILVISLIDGEIFGDTPQQRIIAVFIGICLITGLGRLLFHR